MDFLISSAMAEGGAASPQGGLFGMLLPLLLLVVFFFLFIRPQQKRMKEHKGMVEALKKGDEVVTNGGLVGSIAKVDDAFISLKVGENVEVMVQKQAVANLLPKGTLKKEKAAKES